MNSKAKDEAPVLEFPSQSASGAFASVCRPDQAHAIEPRNRFTGPADIDSNRDEC